jgi:hypothetical protein
VSLWGQRRNKRKSYKELLRIIIELSNLLHTNACNAMPVAITQRRSSAMLGPSR